MVSISLCMIIKNEEDVIGRCLDSVKDIVDEIIIVDTGSTDSSKEIVSKYTDKIYDFIWIDDFSEARNFSFSKATKDYVMWLDADDVIFEKDRLKLKNIKETLSYSVDMVMMKYDIAFDSNGNTTFSYYRERLFKRIKNYKWEGPIHEVISPSGNVIYSDFSVSHKKIHRNDPKRNLRIFEKIIKEGTVLDPRQQFYYARELYYNGRYKEAIDRFNEFLDSDRGWIENCINACKDMSDCYRLLGDDKGVLNSLLKSLEYDEPRAEICCELGKYFFYKEKFKIAIFWYEIASTREVANTSGGFIEIDCYGYIPYIQLCVCHDKLGDYKKASYYNEKAGELKPDDNSVEYNRNYFNNFNYDN